jgi:hypothetical protein
MTGGGTAPARVGVAQARGGAAIGVQNVFLASSQDSGASAAATFIMVRRVPPEAASETSPGHKAALGSPASQAAEEGRPVTLGVPHWDPE